MSAISCRNMGIVFSRVCSKAGPKRRFGLGWFLSQKEKFWALRGIDFDVPEGQVLGVIGGNGAGKSTLLRVLTGILPPDEGELHMNGRVSALLALGAGFLADLSGRDNLFLSAMYLGMPDSEIRGKFDDIVGFSGLEEFIDTPIRYYSSGMKARLGFSLAVHVDPDILIVDEVLAAGDRRFQERARERMKELMQRAKAIVIVSHNTRFIAELCDEVIWLKEGRIYKKGKASDIVSEYENG